MECKQLCCQDDGTRFLHVQRRDDDYGRDHRSVVLSGPQFCGAPSPRGPGHSQTSGQGSRLERLKLLYTLRYCKHLFRIMSCSYWYCLRCIVVPTFSQASIGFSWSAQEPKSRKGGDPFERADPPLRVRGELYQQRGCMPRSGGKVTRAWDFPRACSW